MERKNFSHKNVLSGEDLQIAINTIHQEQLPLQFYTPRDHRLLFNTKITAINKKAGFFNIDPAPIQNITTNLTQLFKITAKIDSIKLSFNASIETINETSKTTLAIKFPAVCYCHAERRQEPRVTITDSTLIIELDDAASIIGTIKNISVLGILCTFPMEFKEIFKQPLNAECKLMLTGNRCHDLHCKIHIVRIDQDDDAHSISIAGEFVNLREEDHKQLKTYIKQQQQNYLRFFDKE